jgi:hypothetical protein
LSFDPSNCSLKFQESTEIPSPKVGVALGVWRFTPSHFPTLPGVCDVILGLSLGSHPCNPLALVASPKLGLRQISFLLKSTNSQFHMDSKPHVQFNVVSLDNTMPSHLTVIFTIYLTHNEHFPPQVLQILQKIFKIFIIMGEIFTTFSIDGWMANNVYVMVKHEVPYIDVNKQIMMVQNHNVGYHIIFLWPLNHD